MVLCEITWDMGKKGRGKIGGHFSGSNLCQRILHFNAYGLFGSGSKYFACGSMLIWILNPAFYKKKVLGPCNNFKERKNT